VLVAHRRAGRGVAQAAHEFGQGGTGLGGEDGAGVAQVVPVEVLAADRLACRVEDRVELEGPGATCSSLPRGRSESRDRDR
jgi:hypothetical protein